MRKILEEKSGSCFRIWNLLKKIQKDGPRISIYRSTGKEYSRKRNWAF
jgi:hypothetical protein